jgi:hypothetical protein
LYLLQEIRGDEIRTSPERFALNLIEAVVHSCLPFREPCSAAPNPRGIDGFDAPNPPRHASAPYHGLHPFKVKALLLLEYPRQINQLNRLS